MAEAERVLCKHVRTGSQSRLTVEMYNKAVEDAEELGLECEWAIMEESEVSTPEDAPTFDDLDKAGQKEVTKKQAERAEKFAAKSAAE